MNGSNKKHKKLFGLLQRDLKSVLFTEENINEKVLKRYKKSTCEKYNEFLKYLMTLIINLLMKIKKIPLQTSFDEKNDEIDRSILYSLDSPLHLLHADVAN